MDCRFEIADARILVEVLHVAEGCLQFFLNIGIELDSGFKAPKQVRGDGEIAIGGEFVAFLADSRVHTEDFLNDDDCRLGFAVGARNIGVELGVTLQGGDLCCFGHCAAHPFESAWSIVLQGLAIVHRLRQTPICRTMMGSAARRIRGT